MLGLRRGREEWDITEDEGDLSLGAGEDQETPKREAFPPSQGSRDLKLRSVSKSQLTLGSSKAKYSVCTQTMWIPKRAIFHPSGVQERHPEKEQGMPTPPSFPSAAQPGSTKKTAGSVCNLLLRGSCWYLPDEFHIDLEITGYGRKQQSEPFPEVQ